MLYKTGLEAHLLELKVVSFSEQYSGVTAPSCINGVQFSERDTEWEAGPNGSQWFLLLSVLLPHVRTRCFPNIVSDEGVSLFQNIHSLYETT